MACGCKSGKRNTNFSRTRSTGLVPRQARTLITTKTPNELQALKNAKTRSPSGMTEERRLLERKRRQAILKTVKKG